ncbi:MAG: hypothetical protein ACFBWO_08355 [Paracoccaceae bacterium]
MKGGVSPDAFPGGSGAREGCDARKASLGADRSRRFLLCRSVVVTRLVRSGLLLLAFALPGALTTNGAGAQDAAEGPTTLSLKIDGPSAFSVFVNDIRVRSETHPVHLHLRTLLPFVNKGENTVRVTAYAGEMEFFSVHRRENDEVLCVKSAPMDRTVSCRFSAQPSYDLTPVRAGTVRLDEPLVDDEVRAILEPLGYWRQVGRSTLFNLFGRFQDRLGTLPSDLLSEPSLYYYSYHAPLYRSIDTEPDRLPDDIEFRVYFRLERMDDGSKELAMIGDGHYGLVTFVVDGRNHPIAFLTRRLMLNVVMT